jgi:hypothetical protein
MTSSAAVSALNYRETTPGGALKDERYVWECVRETPLPIKAALIEEAEERESNLNDVAVRILAEHFDYDYKPENVRRRGGAQVETEYRTLMLKLPEELSHRLRVSAVSSGLPARRDVVLAILARHFDIPYQPPLIRKGRRPRMRVPTA